MSAKTESGAELPKGESVTADDRTKRMLNIIKKKRHVNSLSSLLDRVARGGNPLSGFHTKKAKGNDSSNS